MKIEEPFEYRDRLTQPKLIMNACGDQFFLPDSSQFYFDALKGPKYLRYVPNTDHSLKGSDAYVTLMAWQHVIVNKTPLPRFTWTEEAPGRIRVRVTDAPKSVRLWQAHNPKARDFRLDTLGPAWTPTDLSPDAQGQYLGQAETPAHGWTAAMVELTYDLGAPAPLKLTTAVSVTPDRLPHEPFRPELRVKGFLSR
jgi:PhoPQ-activated pathogenicity-related protein